MDASKGAKNESEGSEPLAEIHIEPEHVGEETWPAEGKCSQVLFSVGHDGKVTKRVSIYDMSKVPEGVDDADLTSAIYYDKDPEVKETILESEEADKLLAAEEKRLEDSIEEIEKILEGEDEMEPGDGEHYWSRLETELKPNLDKVQKARQAVAGT